MNGGVKKPAGGGVFTFPRLPERSADVVAVDPGSDQSTMPSRYALDEAGLHSLEQRPAELLQQNLGVLRMRIVSDPVGAQKIMESYWVRVEATTLSDILLVESRIWAKLMEEGDSPALQKVALVAYDRITQHEHFKMNPLDLVGGGNALLATIEHGDFDASREALSIYQGLVQRYYSKCPDLTKLEASGFRTIAKGKIHGVFYRNKDGSIDADMITHLKNLLAIYAQIIFLDGIDLLEVNDGIKWVEGYMHEGHPLQRCAKEVRLTLEMTKDYLECGEDSRVRETPIQEATEGNKQDPVGGVIDTTKNTLKMGVVPAQGAHNVTLNALYVLDLIGAKFKPLK